MNQRELLNLAQCELRAMYARLNIKTSNILKSIDEYLDNTNGCQIVFDDPHSADNCPCEKCVEARVKKNVGKRLRVYQATYILHGARVVRNGAFKNYGAAIKYFRDLGAKIINLHFVGWESGWTLIDEN